MLNVWVCPVLSSTNDCAVHERAVCCRGPDGPGVRSFVPLVPPATANTILDLPSAFWYTYPMETYESHVFTEFMDQSVEGVVLITQGRFTRSQMQNLRASAKAVAEAADKRIKEIEATPEWKLLAADAQERFNRTGESTDTSDWEAEQVRATATAYKKRFPSVLIADFR